MTTSTKVTVKTLEITVNELALQILALQAQVETLEARPSRDRGPTSERTMTEDDAHKILMGELSEDSHKSAAATLGLSYGQVYSARNGFTFKKVYKEFRDLKAEAKANLMAKEA
jgi:hypothetical protein